MKKKSILCLILSILCIGIFSTETRAAEEAATKLKAKSSVSFRTLPATSSTIIRYLKMSEIVTALEKVNAYWYKIKDTQGIIGYVSSASKYIEVRSNARMTSTSPLHSQASTSSVLIRNLSINEELLVIEKLNADWYRVKDVNGIAGFVSTNANSIQTDFSITGVILSAEVLAQAPLTTKLKSISSVSLREQPATSGKFIRYLKTNEIVTALEKVNAYWYKIKDTQGIVGYVSASSKYIGVRSNARIISTSALRSQASTNGAFIRNLNINEELLVMEKINADWYRVKDVNGVAGFVMSNAQTIQTDLTITGIILPIGENIELIIKAGMGYLGTPYEFGSERFNPSTFDCSDFSQQIFMDAAKTLLPSDSKGQANYVKTIGKTSTDLSQLKRGDLLFFMSYKGWNESDYLGIDKSIEPVTHLGIYLGNDQILHTASIESGGVSISTISGSLEFRFLFGGSVY